MADEEAPRPPRRGRKIRVDLRRNRDKGGRDKTESTRRYRADDEQSHDAAQVEHLGTRGEMVRRRTVIVGDDAVTPLAADGLPRGVIIAVRGLINEVDDGSRTVACTVRRILRTRLMQQRQVIAVGDAVRFRPADEAGGEGVIEYVEPRRTILTRLYKRRDHVIAANVDQAIILASADAPPLRPHLIDRFMVAAHQGSMKPIVCINKMDLDQDGFAAEVLAMYRQIGYTALATSASEGRGIEAVRDALRGQTSVIVGMSGVGKSSLLNAADPGLALRVGELSDTTQRGKHTTTTAELRRLSFGGYVVDTPGIRQLELPPVPPEELEAYFLEFVERVRDCRFPDCTHLHEQGCAIIAAVEAGAIFPERYESYQRLMTEQIETQRDQYD